MLGLKAGQNPGLFLNAFSQTLPQSAEFEYGIYGYTPKSVIDSRIIVKSNCASVIPFLEQMSLDAFAVNKDVAIHSKIYFKDQLLGHIPMIDLNGAVEDTDLRNIKEIFKDFNVSGGSLFSSGRSYHIYGHNLIEANRFTEYLGRLLLLNDTEKNVIDIRWIGHRLIAGYCSLRLTKNSPYYLAQPAFIKSF
ncbi:hypothetical protein [Bdellovibrio sp. HCB2-146]|uniref:primase 1D-like protein n=1 Tax=Bdellovibrio sp. HCB2-146 TaxID=3394362 RepID=UPI0039BD0C9C